MRTPPLAARPLAPIAAPRLPVRAAVLAALVGLGVPASVATADSSLVLPLPLRYGNLPARTYDLETRDSLGKAWLRTTRRDDGSVVLEGRSGIEGGAHTRVRAEMTPTGDGSGLRLLRQESRSVDAEGRPMGTLAIDHRKREGSCTAPAVDGRPPQVETVELPEGDRIANVPLNLLFRPLVRGERRELHFQILVCRGGPRIVSAVARVEPREVPPTPGAAELVRIRYELSLPRLLAAMVSRWLPSLSFWFDPDASGEWIGHEMPLYSKGPTVLVLREGYTPALVDVAP